MTVFEKLTGFVKRVFKTTLEIFLEALKLSPNAQGYVRGSITELLLKRKLEQEIGLEVKRIREKWEGTKHPQHHGDLYVRRPGSSHWYVVESKGVKSNSEKWHKLYNFENLKKFLLTHQEKIPWIKRGEEVEPQLTQWVNANLPKFPDQYRANLYEYDYVRKYRSKRETSKSEAIAALRAYSQDQINDMIEERLNYVMSKVKVLETHFVSGTSRAGERSQATPRKDEFNILAVDLVLRYHEHKFVFANPHNLDASGADPNHLQQNYIMGFAFTDAQGNTTLTLADGLVRRL